jgi:hypothetical protein
VKTALAAFTPYVSLWVAHTQMLPDVEVLLELHHQGCWGEADPRDRVANEHNLAHQCGQVVSVLYSARHHRLRFVSDFATNQTLVNADQPDVSGGT